MALTPQVDHPNQRPAVLDNEQSLGQMANSYDAQMLVKRVVDVIVACVALALLAPLFLLVAIAIKVESRGPVFFRQDRWGKDKTVIKIFKFRSMMTELSDVTGVAQTVRNDPRVTKVGKILRKSNIDELPQLINVIRGDMSLVGPRCHAIGMKAAGVLYEDLVPHYHARHMVRPGITGLAQLRGFRGPTDTPFRARARIHSDLHYVENFSLLLDLNIIVGTLRNEVLGGTGF